MCATNISSLPMPIFDHFLAGNGYLGRKWYLFYPKTSQTNLTPNWGGSMSKMITLSKKMCELQTFTAFQCPFLVISWQEMALLGRKWYLFYPKSSQTNLTHNWGGSMSKMIILSMKMYVLQPFPAFQCPFLVISWQEMAIWAGNDIFFILKLPKPT